MVGMVVFFQYVSIDFLLRGEEGRKSFWAEVDSDELRKKIKGSDSRLQVFFIILISNVT